MVRSWKALLGAPGMSVTATHSGSAEQLPCSSVSWLRTCLKHPAGCDRSPASIILPWLGIWQMFGILRSNDTELEEVNPQGARTKKLKNRKKKLEQHPCYLLLTYTTLRCWLLFWFFSRQFSVGKVSSPTAVLSVYWDNSCHRPAVRTRIRVTRRPR